LLDRCEVGQIKSLQLTARNPYKAVVGLSRCLAQVEQALFYGGAIRVAVLVTQHNEARALILVGADLARQLLFEVLLAFKRDTADGNALIQHPRQQRFEHGFCRGLFEEKYQLPHCGSTPLKKPCFQRYPS
jgi:hypothetical protein